MTDNKFLEIVTPTEYSTDLDKAVLTVLDNLTCYKVSGEDATLFLQGQLSNDINEVNHENAQLSSYSTPKGRMLAIFYICKSLDSYLLITSSDIADDVMKRLQMFIMRSKVTITKLDDYQLLGLSGEKASLVFQSLNIVEPTKDYQTTTNEHLSCFKVPGVEPRFLLVGDQAFLQQALQLDKSMLCVYKHEYWQWLDIMNGLPMVNAHTQEAFVPQMANMELINGVSFNKGCYPGQEIVARLHYLGDASRRMFRVALESSSVLQAGDSVYSTETNQEIGKLLTIVNLSENKYEGLAVLRIEAAKGHNLSINKDNDETVLIMDLPYHVPTEPKEKTN